MFGGESDLIAKGRRSFEKPFFKTKKLNRKFLRRDIIVK